MYEQSTLCYSNTNSIRVLNLRTGSETEKVISFRFFGHKVALPGETASSPALQPRKLELLGYCNDIVTVLCDFGPSKGCFLFALNVSDSNERPRCLLKHRLRCTDHIFACHNEKYLYHGTLSARGSHGHQEWLVQGFDLSTGHKLTDEPVQLYDFAGSDLGISVIFRIHDGHFYALSNQTSHESEEVNWTSYYHYIRFAVDDKDPKVEIKTIYRRQDHDGPINDAWTVIEFQVDHETGELLIVECRKEWVGGGSTAIRTYYVQSWDRAYHDDWDRENTVDPNDQVRLTVTEKDNARYERPPHPRVAKYTHTEFADRQTTERREYLRAKTKYHCYDFNNQCYVDLVVDEVDDEGSWRKKDRVRLRVVSRLPLSPLDREEQHRVGMGELKYITRPRSKDRNEEWVRDSEDAFTDSEVTLWPGEDADVPKGLDDILCPGGKAGEVKGRVGEEGIVYMVGPTGQCSGVGHESERALVFLSFEPAWGFEGMHKLDGELARPRRGRCHGKVAGENGTAQKRKAASLDNRRDVKKCKNQDVTTPGKSTVAATKPATSNTQPKERLLWTEKAKYLSISKGYWLR